MSKPRFIVILSSPLLSYLFGCGCLVMLFVVSSPFVLYGVASRKRLRKKRSLIEICQTQIQTYSTLVPATTTMTLKIPTSSRRKSVKPRRCKATKVLLNGVSHYAQSPEVYSNASQIHIDKKDYKRAVEVATIGLRVAKFPDGGGIDRMFLNETKKMGECCTSRDCGNDAMLQECRTSSLK